MFILDEISFTDTLRRGKWVYSKGYFHHIAIVENVDVIVIIARCIVLPVITTTRIIITTHVIIRRTVLTQDKYARIARRQIPVMHVSAVFAGGH